VEATLKAGVPRGRRGPPLGGTRTASKDEFFGPELRVWGYGFAGSDSGLCRFEGAGADSGEPAPDDTSGDRSPDQELVLEHPAYGRLEPLLSWEGQRVSAVTIETRRVAP